MAKIQILGFNLKFENFFLIQKNILFYDLGDNLIFHHNFYL